MALPAAKLRPKKSIAKEKLPGIGFDEKSKRYYPYGNFASYALGYTISEDGTVKGVSGIEALMDAYLKGIDGVRVVAKDKFGVPLRPEDGENELLSNNGILSFVIPCNFLNCIYYNKCRNFINENFKILKNFKQNNVAKSFK